MNAATTAILAEMEDRAKRQLDGMTVNRDRQSRDVLQLVGALRRADAMLTANKVMLDAAAMRETTSRPYGNFADSFGDLFKDART